MESQFFNNLFSTSTWSSHDPPSDQTCWVPSCLKHASLPNIAVVIVDVTVEVSVLDSVEVAVLVIVDVLGCVDTVDVSVEDRELVAVVVSVV